jgi:hypothetical protein
MKSTCILPPLSDILCNSNNYHHDYYYHQQQQQYQSRHNPTSSNRRRPSSHSVLNVSNLLSSSSSSGEEDEYYDDNNSSIKAKRKRASPTQLSVLNRVFQQTFFPSTELRVELGKQLGMSPRTVQIWFQNKRQSIRTRERSNSSSSAALSPPVSPYTKPLHINLPPLLLHLPQPQLISSWPLTPTSSIQSANSFDSSSLLFRD